MINLAKTDNLGSGSLKEMLNRVGQFAQAHGKNYYNLSVGVASYSKQVQFTVYVDGFGSAAGKTVDEAIELLLANNRIKESHKDGYFDLEVDLVK
jgi:hypothetical protein